MKNASTLLFALLFTVCIVASSVDSYATTYTVSPLGPTATLAPPPALIGMGPNIDLIESVYGWQSNNQSAVNNLATCRGSRNATIEQSVPTGSIVSSQSLSLSELTAIPDFREVQFASSPTATLTVKRNPSPPTIWQRLAMRFMLPDTVNLTSVWMYYSSNATSIPLQVYTTESISTYTPEGGRLVATVTLPQLPSLGWGEVKFAQPLNLTRGHYYWVVLNASGIPGSNVVHWGYVGDSEGIIDQKAMSAYSTSWLNETALNTFINMMLVLKVLPVVEGNPSQVMTYSSPDKVNMTLITQQGYDKYSFKLGTNTSIAFMGNWTAQFESIQPMPVATGYTAQPGSTAWSAQFRSPSKPSDPYVWYNRTLTVMPIPLDWVTNLSTDVTNNKNINFTATYSSQSSIYLVQTDNVTASNKWDATWTIVAASAYSIGSEIPSLVISGTRFNIRITAPVNSTRCRITLFNSTDFVSLNRTVLISSNSIYFPVRLNQTGNFIVTLFDEADYPDVSYLIMSTSVTPPLTSLSLQTSSFRVTWGDAVTVAFSYRNTTLGSDQEFPGTPIVELIASSVNFTTISVQATGGGWFSFVIETRVLPAPGDYILTVMVSSDEVYLNETTMLLHVDPQVPSPLPIFLAGGGSAGAVIAVMVAWRYRNRKKVEEEKKMEVLRQTASLARLVVIDVKSGLTAYSRSLGTMETVDGDLISGFLTANQSIMSQVFRGKAPSGLRFADYGEYKVVSHVGKYIMTALFCTEAAGEELQDLLRQFTEEFERKYQKRLVRWDGNLEALRGADTIADRVFSLRLISPYILELDRLTKVKLSWTEKAAVDEARRLSATHVVVFMPRIFDYLLKKRKIKRIQIIATIDSLVREGVFKRLTIDEAALILGQTEQDSEPND